MPRDPFWRTDEELKEHVLTIIGLCERVQNLEDAQTETDEQDYEAAMDDLHSCLLDIYESGEDKSNNPLWNAVMQIRPQGIREHPPYGGRYSRVLRTLAPLLWDIKEEAQEDGETEKANFFAMLASRLNGRQLAFARAVLNGGVFLERRGEQKFAHYFPPIPFSVRREAGVKLSTHPNNVEAVKKAYAIMHRQAAEGPAQRLIEAAHEDMERLASEIYPMLRDTE